MTKYRLHWLSGKPEDVEGDSPANAMNRAGYGAGALPALDYYEELPNGTHGPKKTDETPGAEV